MVGAEVDVVVGRIVDGGIVTGVVGFGVVGGVVVVDVVGAVVLGGVVRGVDEPGVDPVGDVACGSEDDADGDEDDEQEQARAAVPAIAPTTNNRRTVLIGVTVPEKSGTLQAQRKILSNQRPEENVVILKGHDTMVTVKRRATISRLAKIAGAMVCCIMLALATVATPGTTSATYAADNAKNGELPDFQLAEAVPGCRVLAEAAPSLKALVDAAKKDGVQFTFGSESCYRTIDGQISMRNMWCGQGSCGMAAVPGTSNHGWGKAVDFGTPGGMSFGNKAYQWLKDHSGFYGWGHPQWAEPNGGAPESWHWEWQGTNTWWQYQAGGGKNGYADNWELPGPS